MASNAVGIERISKVVGYTIEGVDFSTTSPNLPQRIDIFAEANHANQATITENVPVQITSAKQAGDLFGYGSPIYSIMRILRPYGGSGIGGIPTFVTPQLEAAGAAAQEYEITVSGTATGNGTHRLFISGRAGLEGSFYDINIETGDTGGDILAKIEDAVNAVLGAPVTAASTEYEATLTTKWLGATATGLALRFDTGNDELGLTYVIENTAAGSGTPSIAGALDAIGENWTTFVINSYGTNTTVMSAFEAFNGRAAGASSTGRYQAIKMKPLIALTGSVSDDPSSITDARKLDQTIALCVAPLSEGFQFEAAANYALLVARLAQDSPHLDIGGKYLPDMPVPANGNIGSMASYENRDVFVKKGCSTVALVNNQYQVQDFVTTYHPVGELPAQFAYVRNLVLDWNIYYGYRLLEETNVVGKVLVADGDIVAADNTITPKQWKAVLNEYANDLALRALIADAAFMQDNIVTALSTNNPDRIETNFKYKRTGTVRIASTSAQAGFNFGVLAA